MRSAFSCRSSEANRLRLTGEGRERYFASVGLPGELSLKTLLIDLPKLLAP